MDFKLATGAKSMQDRYIDKGQARKEGESRSGMEIARETTVFLR